MKHFVLTSLVVSAVAFTAAPDDSLKNPLLPKVYDCGALRYNGKYYLGGCNTFGDLYITSDLVNWSGPIHAVDMNNLWTTGTGCDNSQIHSNDIIYHNGTIHNYWSVNYWGKDKMLVHTVHSEASDPMGPYTEPDRNRWLESRIDPKVFRDDDGSLYMYVVRFSDGNAIWGRRMKNYREFADDDVCLQFASQPHTWERMDNKVAEGPWVLKYHDRYYMMYNANHTGTEYGNYQLGVAVSDSPLGFNGGRKYSHPVAQSNQERVNLLYTDLLRYTGKDYSPEFQYTTSSPGSGWRTKVHDDAEWKSGKGGFGARRYEGSSSYPVATTWNTDSIFIRKKFTVPDPNSNLALRMTHNGPVKVWINGEEIYSSPSADYRIVNLTQEQKKAIAGGENVMAISAAAPRPDNAYINASLFDMRDEVADPDIVWTPGQPNILRGPNGFEWWMIYMANRNLEPRAQNVDRILFFGDKLVVDGITSANNPGFKPLPALPTYGDTFDDDNGKSNWLNFDGRKWLIADGALKSKAQSPAAMTLGKNMAAYLWEVNVNPAGHDAGIIVAKKDDANYLTAGFDKSSASLVIKTVAGGRVSESRKPLYDGFRYDVYHQLRVERDGNDIMLWVDEMRLPGIVDLGFDVPAVPGIFSDGAGAEFDGIVYTVGFDDGNDRMNDWEMLYGTMTPTEKGAVAVSPMQAVKGAPAESYEFSAQLSGLLEAGQAGVFPLYKDSLNYVKSVFDSERKALNVSVVKNGKTVSSDSFPLDRTEVQYADARFTDRWEKAYQFDCPTVVDAVMLPRHEFENEDVFVDNMFDVLTMESLQPDGSYCEISTAGSSVAYNPAWNELAIAPTTVSRLVFTNKGAQDSARHIYKIITHQIFKDSYNIRCVREKDRLHILVDNVEITDPLDVSGFGASNCGILSESGTPEFTGIMYYVK